MAASGDQGLGGRSSRRCGSRVGGCCDCWQGEWVHVRRVELERSLCAGEMLGAGRGGVNVCWVEEVESVDLTLVTPVRLAMLPPRPCWCGPLLAMRERLPSSCWARFSWFFLRRAVDVTCD